MSTPIQRYVNSQHPGIGNRLDYSNRRLTSPMPTTAQEFLDLQYRANVEGPSSPLYQDWLAILQSGRDVNSFPDATGGIPRSAQETLNEVGRTQHREQLEFQLDRINPLLHQIDIGGQSLASLGPERARQEVSLLMADCPPDQRNRLLEVVRAIDDSPSVSTGIEIDPSSAYAEPRLEYTAPSDAPGSEDPTGYAAWRSRGGEGEGGIEALMIQSQGQHSAFDGIVPGSDAGGGGTYRADLEAALEDARGDGFNQGDDANTFDPT